MPFGRCERTQMLSSPSDTSVQPLASVSLDVWGCSDGRGVRGKDGDGTEAASVESELNTAYASSFNDNTTRRKFVIEQKKWSADLLTPSTLPFFLSLLLAILPHSSPHEHSLLIHAVPLSALDAVIAAMEAEGCCNERVRDGRVELWRWYGKGRGDPASEQASLGIEDGSRNSTFSFFSLSLSSFRLDGMTVDATADELERGMSRPDVIVNSGIWLNIPILLRDCDLSNERNIQKMERLMTAMRTILDKCVQNQTSLVNRRLLHSSLSTLASSPTLDPSSPLGNLINLAEQCLAPLKRLKDGPLELVETGEFKSMEDAILHNTQTISKQKEEINLLSCTITTLERQLKEEEERLTKERQDIVAEMEAMLTKEREKLNEAEMKVERAKEREQALEIARREAEARIAQLLIEKQNTENNLKESKEREKRADERENQANADRRDADQTRKKIEEEKKRAEAERGKMESKTQQAETISRNLQNEVKKVLEQKEIVEHETQLLSDKVRRLQEEFDEKSGENEKSKRENRSLEVQNDELKQEMTDVPIWVGTDSLQTLDTTAHRLTATTLSQIITLKGNLWITAFTHPIDEGEWELKIRASQITFSNVMLGYIRHPLPENATRESCGSHHSGIGGDFILWEGSMWKDDEEFKPEGTNKECDRVGQTAAIRVNMWTREARLAVDDEEQPGIFPDIPSPLCLGITTGFRTANLSVEVLWLKRL
ncbi:hypothetical protein BLNAU_17199 [Blattamonas nauphoetae]|uniref:Uncharacterized protein n=1 Tax=Blattamonas nauphoetae TaxID=2049346 RepID=A0ABQ9XAI6_9EUKA|nr:hypothetical protein BLNAU_17199 [Blattamonas nauphoetae]